MTIKFSASKSRPSRFLFYLFSCVISPLNWRNKLENCQIVHSCSCFFLPLAFACVTSREIGLDELSGWALTTVWLYFRSEWFDHVRRLMRFNGHTANEVQPQRATSTTTPWKSNHEIAPNLSQFMVHTAIGKSATESWSRCATFLHLSHSLQPQFLFTAFVDHEPYN